MSLLKNIRYSVLILGGIISFGSVEQGFSPDAKQALAETASSQPNLGKLAQATRPSILPDVEIVSDGEQLQGEWQGQTYTIDADELAVRVLDTFDPETGETVDRRMSGQRIVDVDVDSTTGNIAVGVLLDYFAATNTSAVFIIDPQPGAYAIYRAQVPGSRPLPDEFSTYELRTIESVRFADGNLIVRQGDASGAEALVVFKPAETPAMEYVGCLDINAGEGRGLCSGIGG
jgi:hypothetical protein